MNVNVKAKLFDVVINRDLNGQVAAGDVTFPLSDAALNALFSGRAALSQTRLSGPTCSVAAIVHTPRTMAAIFLSTADRSLSLVPTFCVAC